MTAEPILLDYRGQRCPAPVIALGRQARATPGAEVELLADDVAAQFDVPAWCRMRGATLVSTENHTDVPQSGDLIESTSGWTVFRVLLPG